MTNYQEIVEAIAAYEDALRLHEEAKSLKNKVEGRRGRKEAEKPSSIKTEEDFGLFLKWQQEFYEAQTDFDAAEQHVVTTKRQADMRLTDLHNAIPHIMRGVWFVVGDKRIKLTGTGDNVKAIIEEAP